MANLILLQTPLTPSYEHVMDFPNKYIQFNYFMSNFPKMLLENVQTKVDAFQSNILVAESREDLAPYDYAILDDGGKKFYYFIEGFVMETKSKTNVVLTLDVFSTYLDEWKFGWTFVDRCHVRRWQPDGQPIINNVDEGLEYGTMILDSKEPVYSYKPSYIICATTPIGKLETGGGGSGGGGEPTTGDWKNGKTSNDLFRMMKGLEGFAPSLYQNPGDIPTIGYGITHFDEGHYTDLVNNQPNSEEKCAKILLDSLNSNQYSQPTLDCLNSLPEKFHKQNCYDALLSLVYNGGGGAVAQDTTFVKVLKTGTDEEIRTKWTNWWNNNGLLEYRRIIEVNVFLDNNYEKREIQIIGGSGVVVENNGNGWMPS